MRPDLFWIKGPWPGRLAVAARPRGGDWLTDEMMSWRRAGVDEIVSLLEPDEAAQLELTKEGYAAETSGLRFTNFPIPDYGVPESFEAARSLLSNIAAKLEQGNSVAVHCRQGIGRSGLIAAGALIVAGLSVEDAIETASAARRHPVPETAAQRQWLRTLASERLAPTA